jgi:hypothetical protein
VRLPDHSASKGIVDPKMFPPNPEVVQRALEELALLETELESAEGVRERRQIRKSMRRAKAAAATGVEGRHRGATY